MRNFIDHVNLRIPEDKVDECLEFYRNTLGFETWKLEDYRSGNRTSFFLRISQNAVLNIRPKPNFQPPEGKNYDHFCIALDRDIDELEEKIEEEGYKIVRRGNPLGTQGRAPAVYVEDPFGYLIELKEAI